MTRARPTRGADSITLAKPNTTSVHIHQRKPAPLRNAGLQSIPATNVTGHGKVLLSPVASAAELRARNLSERLELASSDIPVRNSTMRGPAYTCPEMRKQPYRAGSTDAFRLPSLSSFTAHEEKAV